MNAPKPQQLRLHRRSRILEVTYADGRSYQLPYEYLRVYSPSAEVRGHGLAEPVLVGGKREIDIVGVDPVGQYALRLRFSDGHSSGLYSWDVFEELGRQQVPYWARYLERLAELGMSRDSEVVKLAALPKKHHPAK